MINIFDCNNWVRVKYEKDSGPVAIRQLFTEAFTSVEPCFYIFDGYNSKASRRKIFPGYKMGRPKVADNFYEVLNLFKKLVLMTPKISIEVPEYEADDVIAHITRNYGGTDRIKIHSTDKDFAALVRANVELTSNAILNTSAEDVRLYKTLVGDKSDKVPGIVRFGDKGWADIQPRTKELWVEMLEGRTEDVPMQGLSDKLWMWAVQNKDLLRSYWKVVDFMPLNQDQISLGTKFGTPNYEEANKILRSMLV